MSPTGLFVIKRSFLCLGWWLGWFAGGLQAQETPREFAAASAFGALDARQLARLDQGDVLIAANTSMKFARGISMQVCYVLPIPPEAAVRLLQTANPVEHPEQDVYEYRAFHDETGAAFETLRLDAKIDAVRRLRAAMGKPAELQLAKNEAVGAVEAARAAAALRLFWTRVLQTRWAALIKGGVAALPACESGGETFSVAQEWKSLLLEEPKIAARFSDLLNNAANPKAPGAAPVFYWSVSKVDRLAAVDFGAIFARKADDHWQVLDADFYVSNGYLSSLAGYEMWPVAIGGIAKTLVWQTDLVSAPGLAGGFGLKRKLASVLMQNDLKSTVRALREDASRRR